MLVELAGVLQVLSFWFESCVCHSITAHAVRKQSWYWRNKALEGDLPGRACCNKGRLAPEMAAQRWEPFLLLAFQKGEEEMLVLSRSLTAAERGDLLEDWHRGQAHLLEILQKKWAHWRELPYVLCALGLEDQEQARRIITEAISKYENTPNAQHHRITQQLLGDGPERTQIDLWLQGHDWFSPELALLQNWRGKLRGIPLCEMSIEAKHACTTRAKKEQTRFSLVRADMTLRMPLIRARLPQPEFLKELAQCMDGARRPDHIVAALGIGEHPTLQLSFAKNGYLKQRVVSSVVYRADLRSQYDVLAHAGKQYAEEKRNREREERRLDREESKMEQRRFRDQVQYQTWTQACKHFKSIASEEEIYSIVVDDHFKNATGNVTMFERLHGAARAEKDCLDFAEDTLDAFGQSSAGDDNQLEKLTCVAVDTADPGANPTGSQEAFLHQFMRILKANPKQQDRVVRLGRGVAGTLHRNDFTVCALSTKRKPDGSVAVSLRLGADDVERAQDSIQVWSPAQFVDLEKLRDSVVSWEPGQIAISLGCDELGALPQEVLVNIVSDMLAAGDDGLVVNLDQHVQQECVQVMQEAGLSKCIGKSSNASSWILTDSARPQ
eukprot:5961940-Karenia_brevis.AAC.1